MATMVLWRAADDDIIVGSASFASTRADAEQYLAGRSPGYGGQYLYRAEVQIDESRVLDILDSDDDLGDLVAAVGGEHPGATTAGEWAPQIADDIQAAGYDWVRVRDSYPVGCETWIFVGADDPDMTMVE